MFLFDGNSKCLPRFGTAQQQQQHHQTPYIPRSILTAATIDNPEDDPAIRRSVVHAPDWTELMILIDKTLDDNPDTRSALSAALFHFKSSRREVLKLPPLHSEKGVVDA
jgi:hypothetical protein